MTPNRFLLDDLAQLAGLPIRKLRYVVDDTELIQPGNTAIRQGVRGRPRTFSLGMGVIIVGAVHLLERGVRRDSVRKYIDHLQNAAWMPKTFYKQTPKGHDGQRSGGDVLTSILREGKPVSVQFADELNVRLAGEPYTTAWLQAATGTALAKKYAPLVVVALDLGAIRDRLLARA